MSPTRKIAGLSILQRTALRKYAQEHPKFTQKQLQSWVEAEFQRTITQPTISESLPPKYSYIDQDNPLLNQSTKRMRQAQWPELEDALHQWVQASERDLPISGEGLKGQATIFMEENGSISENGSASL